MLGYSKEQSTSALLLISPTLGLAAFSGAIAVQLAVLYFI